MLSATDDDEVEVVSIPGSNANMESTRALCEGSYRPDVVGEWREFIWLERILFRAFYDNSESGVVTVAVGIEMRFHVIQDIVDSSLRRSGAGEEIEQGDDLRFIEIFDIVEIEIPGA